MSFWIYRKNKDGKTMIWQIDVAIPLLMMLLVGFLGALFGTRLYGNAVLILWAPFMLSAGGFVLLFISKLSLYRKGIYRSFGSKQMTRNYAAIYKVGYFLIAVGILIQLLLLMKL